MAAPVLGKIWRVKQTGSKGGDGTSWAKAFQSLQDALAVASKGDEIWVARGTYYPDPTDATRSFVLKEDVAVYGGFSGGESERDQRDYRLNVTILSGNIGKGDRTKNSRTILMGADRAVLDGFTITDAYGTDKPRLHLVPADILKGDMVVGGGLRNFMTSPVVRNCVFKNNYSPKGGGAYNVQKPGAEQATFINVDFIDNVASLRGGGVSNDLGAMPRFIDCRFIGNRSMDKGGGLYNDFASSPLIFNTLFTRNKADSAGGMGNDGGSSPLMVNATIEGNTARNGLGAGLYQGTGANNNPILISCVVDDIYNWHEDVVSQIGSAVPEKQTISLADFLEISSLKGRLQPSDLVLSASRGVGYQPRLDGSILLKDALVDKLVQLYVRSEGVVEYHGEYTRPPANRQPVSASVVHVASGSTAAVRDGLSWATAMDDLQSAIELASVSKAEIWIKAGTYRPAKQDERIAAFILYDNVKMYGGFAGSETALTQRPSAGQPTILSAKVAAGSYRFPHVLYGADNVLLDGLTVRDGDATGFTYNGKGGGLLAYHAGKTFLPNGLKAYSAGRTLESYSDPVGFEMTIRNCRFERNDALEGGAIYAFGKADLSVFDTTFSGNHAVYGGAVVDREGVTSTYSKTSFVDNEASRDGGAAYEDYGSNVTFDEVEFRENRAQEKGGAIAMISRASQVGATVVLVKRSTFAANEARSGASICNFDDGTLTVEESKSPPDSIYGAAAAEKR